MKLKDISAQPPIKKSLYSFEKCYCLYNQSGETGYRVMEDIPWET
jgi:hypothetical protein